MKSFLILSFLFYLKASIISNFIKNEDRETKLIQAIIVTKEITNCLTRTKIIPKTIIDTIKAQKTIIVTEDFEYLSDSQYNNFTRDLINSGINFCINENEGLSLNDTFFQSLGIENYNCNMTKLEELIQPNFPNKHQTKGITLTYSRAGDYTEVETYSNLKKYVYDLITQSEETHNYTIYDILFETNCQAEFGIFQSKKVYEKLKEKDIFFE